MRSLSGRPAPRWAVAEVVRLRAPGASEVSRLRLRGCGKGIGREGDLGVRWLDSAVDGSGGTGHPKRCRATRTPKTGHTPPASLTSNDELVPPVRSRPVCSRQG